MNRVAVYRAYTVIEGVMHGSAQHPWKSAEMTAECMRCDTGAEERRNIARGHLATRKCLCGIHGFYDPGRLVGLIELKEKIVARAVLGGVVDVRSEGARGEFAVIEEMWSPPWYEDWLRNKYEVPVNRTPWSTQPYLEPTLDDDVDEILGAPEPGEYLDRRSQMLKAIAGAYFGYGLMIPGATQLRATGIMGTVTGRLTAIKPSGVWPAPAPPRKARLQKKGRMWLSLERIFADGAEHKRAEVINYWHARQDEFDHPPRICFRHPSGDPSRMVNTRFTCSCGPLDRGSGMRELLLRLGRYGLIENVRYGWWKITSAGRWALALDGAYMKTRWRF